MSTARPQAGRFMPPAHEAKLPAIDALHKAGTLSLAAAEAP